jgi:hypothetical protein
MQHQSTSAKKTLRQDPEKLSADHISAEYGPFTKRLNPT